MVVVLVVAVVALVVVVDVVIGPPSEVVLHSHSFGVGRPVGLGHSSGVKHLVSTDNPTLVSPSFLMQWRVPILHSSLTKVVMFCPMRNLLSSKVQHLKYDSVC